MRLTLTRSNLCLSHLPSKSCDMRNYDGIWLPNSSLLQGTRYRVLHLASYKQVSPTGELLIARLRRRKTTCLLWGAVPFLRGNPNTYSRFPPCQGPCKHPEQYRPCIYGLWWAEETLQQLPSKATFYPAGNILDHKSRLLFAVKL